MSCSDIWNAVDPSGAKVAQMGMGCWNENDSNVQQTARSMHVGGVTICMCDGSVRFISEVIVYRIELALFGKAC